MSATTYHSYPAPEGTTVPYVHLDIKALADAVDKDIPVVVNDIAAMNALPTILNLKALVKNMNYRAFVHNGTAWQVMGGVFGHMGRTAGFQTINPATKVIMDAAQILAGGVTFDNANDALVVPSAGNYRVTVQGMFSGATTNLNLMKAQVNGSDVVLSTGPKPDGNDQRYFASGIVTLAANDKVTLIGLSTASTWGTSGYDGVYLEVELVG